MKGKAPRRQMPELIADRQPHAVLDLASRRRKGIKIERLLGLQAGDRPLRLLEIGTGSGGIAHYFGTHPRLACEVDAVDVCDNRLVSEGYHYHSVSDTSLPFEDGHFDVVLSNHVIEHVGEATAQSQHLAELRRVLRTDGIAYLAVPSRWMVVEPHYQLAFLSWLPHSLADVYVRAAGKGTHYDCRPLTSRRLESMLRGAGFRFEQQSASALRLTYELEAPEAPLYRWVLRWIPDRLYRLARRAFPTLIYVLRLV